MTMRMQKKLSNISSIREPNILLVTIIQLIIALGLFTGTIAAIYARPLTRNAANYNAFFRKPWMRLPIYTFFFACGFVGGV